MSRERKNLWDFSDGKHICMKCVHTAGMSDADLSMTTLDHNSCELCYDLGNDLLEKVDNGAGYWITKCKFYKFDKNWDKNTLPHIVYLLRFYDKDCRILPSVMAFHNEACARAAAVEFVPTGCRYEIVCVEVS